MKRIVLIVLLVIALGALVGCGPNKSDDPNVGLWKATSVSMMGMTMDPAEVFESGITLELKANGKFELSMDGETGNGSWDIDGGKVQLTSSDAEMSGTVSGNTMTLIDVAGMGLDIVLEK